MCKKTLPKRIDNNHKAELRDIVRPLCYEERDCSKCQARVKQEALCHSTLQDVVGIYVNGGDSVGLHHS